MNNKSLIVYEKGFFYKIKMFFKNIFNKEELQESNDYKYTNEQEKRSTFSDEIKIKPDFEKEKLLKMQKDYEDGLIKEEDMTQEQEKGIKITGGCNKYGCPILQGEQNEDIMFRSGKQKNGVRGRRKR